MKNSKIFKLAQSLVVSLLVSVNLAAYAGYNISGVIDKTGHTVVPCVYHRIDYLGHGFFFAHQLNRVHPLRDSNKGIVFDYDGHAVSVKVPPDCSLAGAYLPEERKGNTATKQLPEGTVLKIAKTSGYGLCTPNGELVLPAEFGFISAPNHGCFPVWTGTPGIDMHLQFIFDSNTGKRVAAAKDTRVSIVDFPHGNLLPFTVGSDPLKAGYMARTGEIVILPKFASARPFTTDGLAVVAYQRDGQQAYIDKSGKVVSPLYTKAEDFVNGFAVVVPATNTDGKKCLVNTKFNITLLGPYQDPVPITKNSFAVRKDPADVYEVVDSFGRLLYKLPNGVQYVEVIGNAIICGVGGTPDGDKPNSVLWTVRARYSVALLRKFGLRLVLACLLS
ncbi:hypothetical protein BH11CYA1_BH11CYA1_09920 [soil metagenome]